MNAIACRLGKLLDKPYLTLLIVTEMLFLWMVTNNPVELGNQGGGVVFLYITFVCFLQMAMLARFHRIARTRGAVAVCIQRLIFATFFVFNIYSVLLVHISTDSGIFVYRNHLSVVLLVMILLLYGVKLWKFVSVSGLAFGMIVSIQLLLDEFVIEKGNVAMPRIAAVPTFERRSNVYFLSFDALIPTDVVDFFLHQPEPEYSVYLREHGFREVKNSFAASVPTRPSLNTIAAVDTNYCNRLGEDCLGLVIGKHQSPLYTVFKKNGYETVFIGHTNYFGDKKGPYLDRYIVGQFEVCRYTDEEWAFLGYCWLEKHRNLNLLFRTIYPGQSVETMIARGIKASPHFFMTYTFLPTHTPRSYDTYDPKHFKIYQERFLKKQLETVRVIETFIEAIKTRDPNSVVIIFGDHGAWISRSWKKKQGKPDPAGIVWTEDLMILERHRVALFVYPKDFCVDEIRGPYTLNRLGRSVAKCLSNGQDPFSEKHHDGDRDWSRYVMPK
jgi:hypothetical protein